VLFVCYLLNVSVIFVCWNVKRAWRALILCIFLFDKFGKFCVWWIGWLCGLIWTTLSKWVVGIFGIDGYYVDYEFSWFFELSLYLWGTKILDFQLLLIFNVNSQIFNFCKGHKCLTTLNSILPSIWHQYASLKYIQRPHQLIAPSKKSQTFFKLQNWKFMIP